MVQLISSEIWNVSDSTLMFCQTKISSHKMAALWQNWFFSNSHAWNNAACGFPGIKRDMYNGAMEGVNCCCLGSNSPSHCLLPMPRHAAHMEINTLAYLLLVSVIALWPCWSIALKNVSWRNWPQDLFFILGLILIQSILLMNCWVAGTETHKQ